MLASGEIVCRINCPKYESRQLRIQKSSSAHCAACIAYYFHYRNAHRHTYRSMCFFLCRFASVYVCVCDRLKQTKISGFLQQHAIPYHYYYYYYYFYVQPSSFDHFNAYEYPYTHTPMRVNEIHIHTKAVDWWQYDLNTSMVHMHVNVPWQCWHSDTVPSMQLCIPILTSVLSLPHACVCVSLRVCMRSIPADYFASIFIHYTYITISLVFEYIWSDYNHLCTQPIYTYRRTTRTHSANTFTHYTNESTSNNIGNNNREEKREKYKYKCWKYRTHKRIHTLTGLVGWLISNMYIQ